MELYQTMPRISKATKYNWKKLNSDSKEKLTKRANKTQSQKRVIATGYLNYAPANLLLLKVLQAGASIGDTMYTLCISMLEFHHILGKSNVAKFISQFDGFTAVNIDIPQGTWSSDKDVLGFIYQSLVTEGERNLTGLYYTNRKVLDFMLRDKHLEDGETFLDPCCGSGAYLLSVQTDTPEYLYGFDIDPIAVMVTETNLLVKYSNHDFHPNVYCLDFLKNDLFETDRQYLPSRFDNIYTNPPWGADKEGVYVRNFPEIRSKERSSMFMVKALKRLNVNGSLCFLLPASLLKIKAHNDVRKFILSNSAIRRIDLYTDRFDGVFTDYFSINLSARQTGSQKYIVSTGEENRNIELSESEVKAGVIGIEKLTLIDDSIMKKMEAAKHDDLRHSQWALGIVTGDNRNKVKKDRAEGLEPVYTGKQVSPFKLQEESSFIHFAPETFQQCAREEFFRAPEKLIYKFIARFPIVAYDNRQCLCLNSANILIPKLDGISVKSVAALLNSSLYHYYYSIKFSDIKVLKGNLQELPFPKLTKSQDEALSNLVTSIQSSTFSEKHQKDLDKTVYELFNITSKEQQQIMSKIK